jgi:hypothetical protein
LGVQGANGRILRRPSAVLDREAWGGSAQRVPLDGRFGLITLRFMCVGCVATALAYTNPALVWSCNTQSTVDLRVRF